MLEAALSLVVFVTFIAVATAMDMGKKGMKFFVPQKRTLGGFNATKDILDSIQDAAPSVGSTWGGIEKRLAKQAKSK